jgi:hypothetical protein
LAALGAAAALITALLPGQAASAATRVACLDRANSTYTNLLECVSLNGVREHQAAFQKIADNSSEPVYPGTRAAVTVGYDDSVDYVGGMLRDAGYEVTLNPVEITFNFPPVLEQLTPNPEPYETGVFSDMNCDMVGSPNYIFMVYDADETTFPAPPGVPIPEGSEAIEDLYESFHTAINEPYDDTEFSGRSDYEAFILAGIPSSGLFTGAEVIRLRSSRQSGVVISASSSTLVTTRLATLSRTSTSTRWMSTAI